MKKHSSDASFSRKPAKHSREAKKCWFVDDPFTEVKRVWDIVMYQCQKPGKDSGMAPSHCTLLAKYGHLSIVPNALNEVTKYDWQIFVKKEWTEEILRFSIDSSQKLMKQKNLSPTGDYDLLIHQILWKWGLIQLLNRSVEKSFFIPKRHLETIGKFLSEKVAYQKSQRLPEFTDRPQEMISFPLKLSIGVSIHEYKSRTIELMKKFENEQKKTLQSFLFIRYVSISRRSTKVWKSFKKSLVEMFSFLISYPGILMNVTDMKCIWNTMHPQPRFIPFKWKRSTRWNTKCAGTATLWKRRRMRNATRWCN